MFPDSKIATKFNSAYTKTTCIVKGILIIILQCLWKACVTMVHFRSCVKYRQQVFCYFGSMGDESVCMPATRFLDMPICNITNAQSLFDLIDEALTKRNIPWAIVGFESDTCNVMIGWHFSSFSNKKQKKSKVFVCASLLVKICIQCIPLL